MIRIKKIWNIISWTLIIIVLVIALCLIGFKFAGYKYYTVLSGSMEPKFKVGSVVFVKDIKPENIKKNDIITFRLKDTDTIATHRVVSVDSDKKQFTTKGDANENNDNSPVAYSNVIGKADKSVPYVGYFAKWITNYPGKVIATVIVALIIFFMIIPDKGKKDKSKKGINSSVGEINT